MMDRRSAHLRFDLHERREIAAVECSTGWLCDPARFALGPTLPLQVCPQFHHKSNVGSLFHAAIADTEPDGWARRVIMRDHIKFRQELRREGKEEAQPLNVLNYLLAVDDFSVPAHRVFATKAVCSSARRKKGRRDAAQMTSAP